MKKINTVGLNNSTSTAFHLTADSSKLLVCVNSLEERLVMQIQTGWLILHWRIGLVDLLLLISLNIYQEGF